MARPEFLGDSIFAIVLLLLSELLGAPVSLVHLCGALILVSRCLSARTFVRNLGKWSGEDSNALLCHWSGTVILVFICLIKLIDTAFGGETITSF